jgi:hypothetical protein
MRALRLSLPLPLLLLMLAACTTNPFKTAETPEQNADALYGSYAIWAEQGAEFLKDPTVADEVKRPVAEAIVAAQGPTNSFQDALIQLSKVKAELAAGTTSQEKLLIAQQNVDRWFLEAKPLIDKLISAVSKVAK